MSTAEWCGVVGNALVAGRQPPLLDAPIAMAVRHFLRLQGLSGLAARRMEQDAPPFLPEDKAAGVRQDWADALKWSRRLDQQCERIAQTAVEVTSCGLAPPILLKGPVVASRYRDPSVRTYVDIDLLVPPEQVPAWARVLGELGFWGSPSEVAATRRRHQEGVSLVIPGAASELSCDLHGCLFIERRARQLDYSALAPFTVPSAFPGLSQLSPEALLVALALHLAHHSRGAWRLIWLRDFAEVGTPDAVRRARDLAAVYDVAWALERALHATQQVLGHDVWDATEPSSGALMGLARVHELESAQYLRHLALVRELGPWAGVRYLASRVSPRRFALRSGGIDWQGAWRWARLAALRTRATPWSRYLAPGNGSAPSVTTTPTGGGKEAGSGPGARPTRVQLADRRASNDRSSVALVFVATNERAFLLAALESLFRSSPTLPVLEVIVVDNASVDGVADEVRRRWPGVRVLQRGHRRSLASNLNAGIAETRARYVMVCNSDVVFRPRAVERLAGFLDAHEEVGVAAPALFSPEGKAWPSARRWYTARALMALRWPGIREPRNFPSVRANLYADSENAGPLAVDWVHCPATMVRRAALNEVGQFDERFRVYFGDVDLCLRMHEAGWQVWFIPDAEIVHHWQRASAKPLCRAWFSHLQSLVWFVGKHKGLKPGTLKGYLHAAVGRSSHPPLQTGPAMTSNRPGFRGAQVNGL